MCREQTIPRRKAKDWSKTEYKQGQSQRSTGQPNPKRRAETGPGKHSKTYKSQGAELTQAGTDRKRAGTDREQIPAQT